MQGTGVSFRFSEVRPLHLVVDLDTVQSKNMIKVHVA